MMKQSSLIFVIILIFSWIVRGVVAFQISFVNLSKGENITFFCMFWKSLLKFLVMSLLVKS